MSGLQYNRLDDGKVQEENGTPGRTDHAFTLCRVYGIYHCQTIGDLANE